MSTSEPPPDGSELPGLDPEQAPASQPIGGDQYTDPDGKILIVAPFAVPQTLAVLSGIVIRLLVVLLGLCIVVYLIFLVGPISLALFLALFTTALAGPVARVINKVLPRVLSVVLALLIISTIALVIIVQVVRSIASQSANLTSSVTSGISDIEKWLQTGPLHLSDADLQQAVGQAQKYLGGLGKTILGDVASDLGSLGILLTAGSVFLFATIFFMISGSKIWGWIVSWVPARARVQADHAGKLAWITMAGYTRGVVLVAICDAVLVFIGLVILGIPMAGGLAAIVFMGAFIPVIGAPIATLVAAVVALASEGVWKALLVVALTVVVGSFDGDVMQPLVMGKAVSLHPLAIVTIIGAGAMTLGIIGALIAVPVASSIYSVIKYLSGRLTPREIAALDAEDEEVPAPA